MALIRTSALRTAPVTKARPQPTGRAPWRWAVTGAVLGAAVALVAYAPAHWLAAGIAWASKDQVQLREPRGTVWTGSAQWVLTGGAASRDQMALPGRIDWQLRPALTGLNMRWNADCCMRLPLPIRIQPHWGGVTLALQAHESQWPAALLTGLGTPWNTIQPQGQLLLRTPGLSIAMNAGRLQIDGAAELQALAVTSRLSTVQPLGSYRVQINGGDMTSLQLSTIDGALQLQGQGQWVGQRLRFQGEAWAADGRESALANLLTMIGQRNGSRVMLSVG